MATFLYKLGRLAFRRRRITALIWLLLFGLAGFGASSAGTAPEDDFALPGTEAQQAFDLLEERFPGQSADGATARIVFEAPDGQKITATDHREAVDGVLDGVAGNQVEAVSDPFADNAGVSKDGSTAYAVVDYKVTAMEIEDETRDAINDVVDKEREDGLTIQAGGDALMVEPDMGNGEIIGVGIALVVLVITFGSLVAAGLPIITALVGVGIGISSITALANVLDLSATTSTLAMMIGLAVGIDYALFIASRYRAELTDGHSREEAAGRAVGTAGSAVVFAGLTVIIALAGLAVVNIPILTKMGLAAAGTVALAVLIALTLVPAALGIVGKRIYGRKVRKANPETGAPPASEHLEKPNMGTRWSRAVLKRPVLVLSAAIIGLGALAAPVASMELGLPDEGTSPTDTTQRKAYDMLSEAFGPGFNGPVTGVIDATEAENPQQAADDAVERISDVDGVVSVTPASFNEAGDTATFMVTPTTGPSDTDTEKVVKEIRGLASGVQDDTGAELYLTGSTAVNIDFSQVLDDALVPYLALVVGLAFILLMLVFRSLLVPLKAALGFLFSVLAALGAVVAVFQWGWLAGALGVEETGPIMSMMPIFLIGVVFGLAMDYEVFLVSRMREAYVHGESAGDAVVTGFRYGARVVTAAAVIMISVFAGFIGAGDSMIKMMGFGLAVAVLFDAFLVRMTIVPAVLALIGKSAWWLPKWLDRILPNVDVEGEKLYRQLAAAAPVAPPAAGEEREPEPTGVR
ncbi:MMPL family transporter [Streptomyces sp. WMMC500]|uniref:MMPL family transporter n=1 Tax=Streptomyces sp. WMMC500 TaxID=3015154 RepID=UPI00248B6CF1|nr:MMPL family transporter [Streptomyces sp. WMMC500]WBB60555.1 MMPL family transporter [Streptomyces sp. WMMC500]